MTDFSDLYQPIITLIFLRGLFALCCALLIGQMELVEYNHSENMSTFRLSFHFICEYLFLQSNDENHSIELLVIGFDANITFVSVFIACELGQCASNVFCDINALIDQYQWYRFPRKTKQMLPVTMIIVQKPVSIECFGSISCCHDTFKRVCVTSNLFADF